LEQISDTPIAEAPKTPSQSITSEVQASKKKCGKKNWPAEVGTRDKSFRTLVSSWKKAGGTAEESLFSVKISAVGTDPDYPTDIQARLSQQAYEWAKARVAEQAQLEKYQVFTKVEKSDIPEDTKIVDTKWVYLVKRRADSSIEKYKTRKVGRGFTQEAGINYDEIYAQMIRLETLKILLVIALHRDWAVRQWDVVAAYLQALLQHDVYITDINEDGETEYWKLNKALYGLKQAGHEWFKTLSQILSTFGMHQCISDEGTYTNITIQPTKAPIIISTHVDDLIGIAPTEKDLDNAEKAIEQRVELDK